MPGFFLRATPSLADCFGHFAEWSLHSGQWVNVLPHLPPCGDRALWLPAFQGWRSGLAGDLQGPGGKQGCPAGPFPVTKNTQPPGKLPVPFTSGSRVEDFKVKGVVSSSPPPFKAQSFSSTLTPSPSGFHPHFSMTHTRSLLPGFTGHLNTQGKTISRPRPPQACYRMT